MRIIGGVKGGRRLVEWDAPGIRPMRDFVRGALFSIVSDFIPDATFLDLYCGTGSVGLEALSRGARACTFVDRSPEACAIVRRNLDALDFLSAGEVVEGECLEVLDRLARVGRKFDLVFVGPPYHQGLAPKTLDRLADGCLLTGDPVVITEIHELESLASRFGGLELVDRRRYGDNQLLFYRLSTDAPREEPSSS
ncbi:MAG: 16S rRNA (guanine(966)-N(2))-methyltransferase RsmD [Thermotogota bacterium]